VIEMRKILLVLFFLSFLSALTYVPPYAPTNLDQFVTPSTSQPEHTAFPFVPEVQAQPTLKNFGVTKVAHDYDPYTPVDPVKTLLGDGTVIYTTTYGQYIFDKSKPYIFSYIARDSIKYVDKSQFWLILPTPAKNATGFIVGWDYINTFALLDAKIGSNVWYPTASTDTYWQIKYGMVYKGGALVKDTVVGNLTVTWRFYREERPKITILFEKDSTAWGKAGFSTHCVVWSILPLSKTYCMKSDKTIVQVTTGTSTIELGNLFKAELDSSADVNVWSYPRLIFDWGDTKASALVYGGVEKTFGGKGLTVCFGLNATAIDPTFGLTSTGGTSYPTSYVGDHSTGTGSALAGYLHAKKFTTTAPSTLTKIGVYSVASGNVKVGLYSDASNYPGSILISPVEQAVTANQYNDVSVGPYYLASGSYWLAAVWDVNGVMAYLDGGGSNEYYVPQAYGDPWSNPYTGSGDSSTDSWKLYGITVAIKGYIKGTKATLSVTAASFDKISFYSHSATGNGRLAVFDNASPKALIWESGSTALSANAWVNVTITGVTNKAAGTYWLCWQYNDAASAPSYTVGSSGDGFYKAQDYAAFPSTISGETSTSEKWSIFITYSTNAAPSNGAGSISDMDDTNNLYAQKKWYTGSSAASDANGYADIHYMEFRLLQGATVRARFQYHEDDNTFNIQEGSAAWDLDVSGSSASRSGNDITVTWKFKPQWDAVEESAIEIELYVVDAASASDTDTAQTNYADVVKTLTVSGFASNPVTFVNPSSSITFSGTVYYVNDPGSSTPSTSYPPDGEFTSVHVHNAAHMSQGSDTTVVNGAFSLAVTSPATVGAYTYHPYIDMADADYTDADASGISDGFTVERVEFWQWGTTDSDRLVNKGDSGRVWVKARYDSDDAPFTSGNSLSINGTSATYSAADGYWYADFTVSTVSNKTFAISAFTDSTRGLTASVETGSKVYVQWTELTATLSDVDGSSGTYQTIINVTLTWAHNSTGVNTPTVYVCDGPTCIGKAVGNATGFASVTTNATIHGSGTLSINGTKAGINVNTPLSLSYSITVSDLEVQPQTSYTSGQLGSVTVNFKNEAVLNAVDLKLENVSLRWRVLIGEVQFWSYTLAIDDLAAASWRNQTYSITITGVPQTGVYTLRTELVQLGSEYVVASTDKSVYIMFPGGSPVGGEPTPGGLKLSILGGAFETPTGKTTIIEVPVSLQGADVLELTDVSVNATWVQLNQTLPIQLNAGASKLRFMVTPPSEGVYTCLIAVKGKSGGQTVTSAGYFTLDTYAALPTPSGPAAQWILLGLAGLVGGVFLVGTRARKKTEKKY